MKIVSRKIWGSKAWHLLHAFSLNNYRKIPENKKHNYYIFYTSFIHVLPCEMCSSHYSDIIYNINILEECHINRLYLMRWVYKTHNIVNERLNKSKYSYNKFIEDYKNTETSVCHKDIFYILIHTFNNFDYDRMSLYKYDQIYNFFINFCILYPDLHKRRLLKKILSKTSFKNIETPKQFNIWFRININDIKNIIC